MDDTRYSHDASACTCHRLSEPGIVSQLETPRRHRASPGVQTPWLETQMSLLTVLERPLKPGRKLAWYHRHRMIQTRVVCCRSVEAANRLRMAAELAEEADAATGPEGMSRASS